MLKNYLTIALRNLRKHKLNTVINIGGLAVGLACSILIFLFVRHELSYDQFFDNADRVYRVNYQEIERPAQRYMATTSPPMGPALREMYPEVVDYVRLRDAGQHRHLLGVGEQRFYEDTFFYADSAFFRLFSFPLQRGDPETALAAINSIVLTQETARKYFGNDDPLGQTMTFDDDRVLTVTGVLAPIPGPTHLAFDFLLSFSTFRVPLGYPVTLDSWTWISFHNYVLLADDANPDALEAKLPEFVRIHQGDETAREIRLRLQPVTDIYLGEPTHTLIAAGNPAYLYVLSAIAALILLLACFNYTNLSVAHAIQRGTEVSMRKVLGARPRTLVAQFLGESVLTVLIALLLALGLVQLASSGMTSWVGWTLSLRAVDVPLLLLTFAGIALLVGVLAGSYPAFVLSRLRPVQILKGKTGSAFTGAGLRHVLVVLQFSIAIALITGSLIVAKQMAFISGKSLGFDKEEVVVLHMRGETLHDHYPALRERLLQNPDVVQVSKAGHLFDGHQGSVPIFPQGGENLEPHAMSIYGTYYDYFETLGIDIVQGRVHSRDFPADSASGIVLNQAAADLLEATVPGWENPLGKHLGVGAITEGPVIGVVENFHFASLHDEIAPLVLYIPPTLMDHVIVRVRPDNASALLASLERDWQAVAPALPFSYTFLDDHIQRLYEDEARFTRLTTVFTLLTILLACLGLYGLVAFVTQLRTKEIGIRKVLGASIPGIVALLSTRFLGYVVLANLIAWPLAYFGTRQWLDNFAYRIDISWPIFLMAGLMALGIALLTMSYQSIRAALADPVKSLRYE